MEIFTCKRAKELGLKRFFNGKPCPQGHIVERCIHNGACVQCHRERLREYKRQKRAKAAADTRRQLQEANPDRIVLTREEARERGLKQYFSGIPCPQGHIAERRVCNGGCLTCKRIDAKADRTANPEKHNAKARKRFAANRDHYNEKHRKWRTEYPAKMAACKKNWRITNGEREAAYNKHRRIAYPEKIYAWGKAWRINNPDKVVVLKANRRARELGASGSHTAEDIKQLLVEQGGKCAYYRHCGNTITLKTKRNDHIVPLKAGGSNYIHNIQLTCHPCNCRKHAIDPLKFGLSIDVLNGSMAYAKIMSIMGE
jgi:5-methylcytosine-specific restriction endonuclease McrA